VRDVHVTVAAVVAQAGKFLFVEESIGGRTVLNQPAGHWEAGESLLEAAQRETLEETGWEVEPTALLGVYEFEPPDLGYGFLRFAYLATPRRHHADRKLDPGIARALWLTPDELRREHARHRSPMVQRCVDDALAGKHHPLSLIGHL
jgi:8-oxo-dGTP pyrophosphatase MutT (NUDIX family)